MQAACVKIALHRRSQNLRDTQPVHGGYSQCVAAVGVE